MNLTLLLVHSEEVLLELQINLFSFFSLFVILFINNVLFKVF